MSLLTTAQVAQHLRLSGDDEVDALAVYVGAAEGAAAAYLNRKVFLDLTTLTAAVAAGTAGADPIVMSDSIRAAMLLILGHLYANREDSAIGLTAVELPMGSQYLLRPDRVGMGV